MWNIFAIRSRKFFWVVVVEWGGGRGKVGLSCLLGRVAGVRNGRCFDVFLFCFCFLSIEWRSFWGKGAEGDWAVCWEGWTGLTWVIDGRRADVCSFFSRSLKNWLSISRLFQKVSSRNLDGRLSWRTASTGSIWKRKQIGITYLASIPLSFHWIGRYISWRNKLNEAQLRPKWLRLVWTL